MAQQGQSFDMSRISTAGKIILVGGLLYFIDLFLAWQKVCISFLGHSACGTASGWHGIGILNGLIVIVILVMEVLLIAGVQVNVGTQQMRMQIFAGLAGALLVFTIIKVLVDNTAISWPAWLGLILAAVVAYGGYMSWQEGKAAPPPPPPGGGFAA